MKRLFIALILSELPLAAPAASLPYWRDIDTFSKGAVTERTELVYHPDRASALGGSIRNSVWYSSLNGDWDFLYLDDSRQLPASLDGVQWSSIKVPGNWEVQGFGVPIYVNTRFEFKCKDPEPPTLPDLTPLGVYRKTFTIPSAWTGREVFLNLCGVKGGCYVYVNGREAGYNEDSKDLARFNISRLIKEEDNEIVLKVFRWSTGSYLEAMDFWRISGIERDVYLSSEASDKGFDFNVVSTLSEDLRDGELSIDFSATEALDFSCELLDPDGKNIWSHSTSGAGGSCRTVVPGVKAWSAENPVLYTLVMCVDGQWTRFHVGFRRFEIVRDTRDGRCESCFLVNGKPVKFKGVNLHEHNPNTGHYVDRELLLKDLRLMKENNINAIRTCHYPQQRDFYELCDSLGFYVYSEANIESHGMFYDLTRTLGNAPEWYTNHLYRARNMYFRLRNYPCVTILSLGNEGGNGYNFYRLYDELKGLEKDGMNRPVCYERAEYEWNTDMLVPQYPGASWFRRLGEEGYTKPVCPSEYAHAMGNSTGSLDLQWEQIYRFRNLQGGFIWDWVDQGLAAVNDKGQPFWAYGGDYGVKTPSDNNFCCNGVVGPDRTPHPGLQEVKHVYRNIACELSYESASAWVIGLCNRFYFSDLSDYRTEVKVYEANPAMASVKLVGSLDFKPEAEAQDTVFFEIPKDFRMKDGLMYYADIASYADRDLPLVARGTLLASDQIILAEADAPKAPECNGGRLNIRKSAEGIFISSDRVQFVFSKGVVTSYMVDGREMFKDGFGLRPNFWRGPNDNDYGDGMPSRCQQWKTASREFNCSVNTRRNGGCVILNAIYHLEGGHKYFVSYKIHPSSEVEVSANFVSGTSARGVDIPRIGLRLRTSADNDTLVYFARGPHENYCDRLSSAFYGRYESRATDEYHAYVRPQENGHHCGCSRLEAGELCFTAMGSPFEFNALRASVEDFDSEEAIWCDYQWTNLTPDEEHDEAAAANHLRRQTHICDVPIRDYVEICLDAAMTGVGGYDSWGARPEESRTLWDNENRSFSFIMSVR